MIRRIIDFVTNMDARAWRTVAVSGVIAMRPRTAFLARSRERVSISSATAKRKITTAASGHSPMAAAPMTATLIRKFILRVKVLSAIQPFL